MWFRAKNSAIRQKLALLKANQIATITRDLKVVIKAEYSRYQRKTAIL